LAITSPKLRSGPDGAAAQRNGDDVGVAIDFEAEGLLNGLDDGPVRDARLELLRTLEHEGFTLEELRRAAGEDRLALLPVERVLETEGPRHTLREVAAESGLELSFLEEARRALGDPAVDPDARVLSNEELELARHAKTLLDAGLDEESFFELIRVMSQSLDSIASALVATLGQALLQPGDTERDLGLRYSESLRMLAPLAGPALELILGRRLREQIREAVIGRAELESGRLPGAQRIVVAFVDIVGFTELGEQVPADELAAVVRDFERRVDAAVQPPVRLVKTIGDAAMLVATDPDPLLAAVLGLVGDSAEHPVGLLLRGGVAAGEALQRAGDWYGRPVNLASRLTAFARRGSVVATGELREAARGEYAWSFAGNRRFKGVAGEVAVYRVRRAPR
jgi:adenylate cyclase